MHEPVQNIKGSRLPPTATGCLAGFGVGYLVAYFGDIAAKPPLFYWTLMTVLLPFIVLGIVALVLWIRKPLSTGDAPKFVIYFWVPFVFLYWTTYILYWLPRI